MEVRLAKLRLASAARFILNGTRFRVGEAGVVLGERRGPVGAAAPNEVVDDVSEGATVLASGRLIAPPSGWVRVIGDVATVLTLAEHLSSDGVPNSGSPAR